jgi:hypothetical protein
MKRVAMIYITMMKMPLLPVKENEHVGSRGMNLILSWINLIMIQKMKKEKAVKILTTTGRNHPLAIDS